jgi:hypothetical protein
VNYSVVVTSTNIMKAKGISSLCPRIQNLHLSTSRRVGGKVLCM